MSYPPETSRSCHEADGRSDRSGGSGGAAGSGSSASGVYGSLPFVSPPRAGVKWPTFPTSLHATEQTSGSAILTPTQNRVSQNWRKWSLGLNYLLQDSDGVALFKSYLRDEGCSNLLDFWFACQGFRSKIDPSDHRKIAQLIKAIYRTYIRGSSCTSAQLPSVLSDQVPQVQSHPEPIRLRAETRRLIAERISHRHTLDQTVFNPAQLEVENFLRTTAYPAFLKSDVYVAFLQSALHPPTMRFQQDAISTPWPIVSTNAPALDSMNECMSMFPITGGGGSKILPTVEEDKELKSDSIASRDVSTANISCPYPTASLISVNYPQSYCSHCLHCHSQGHVPPSSFDHHHYPSYEPPAIPPHQFGMSSKPGTICYPPVPLTVENIQMTRFYRADLSSHETHPNKNIPAPSVPRLPSLNPAPSIPQTMSARRNIYHQAHGPSAVYPRTHSNYPCTHWADAMCPKMSAPNPKTDPRLSGTRLLSQPPNPYHISYAPVSARDSERHSQSSGARTDDTHSHTDSSHDGGATRRWHCGLNSRYPDSGIRPTHPVHSHAQTTSARADQPLFDRSTAGPTFSPPYSSIVSPPKIDSHNTGFSVTEFKHTLAQRTPPSAPEPSKSRHQRRSARRNPATNWRGGKSLDTSATTEHQQPASKSSSRSHALAEKDPPAFFRLLSEKLQRVLNDQMVTERLDELMTETSPNPADEPKDPVVPETCKPATDAAISAAPIATASTTTTTTTSHSVHRTDEASGLPGSFLKCSWADKLLAAAREQHENSKDDAQAILEDHCSRIWAASVDRTPTSSGSSGGVPQHPEPAPTDSPTNAHENLITCSNISTDLLRARGPNHTSLEEPWNVTSDAHLPLHHVLDCSLWGEKESPRRTDGSITHSISHHQSDIAPRPCTSDQPVHRRCPPVSPNPSATMNSASPASNTATTTTSLISTSTPSGPLVSSPGSSGGGSHSLVIGYYLCDDPVPYRSVWPSTEITLGQFKQLIPKKKGSFRYFFKKFSDEFDSAGVVHQEITNDHYLLPLWEGKVVAKVERID